MDTCPRLHDNAVAQFVSQHLLYLNCGARDREDSSSEIEDLALAEGYGGGTREYAMDAAARRAKRGPAAGEAPSPMHLAALQSGAAAMLDRNDCRQNRGNVAAGGGHRATIVCLCLSP